MNERICKNCKHYYPTMKGWKATRGDCRIHPPKRDTWDGLDYWPRTGGSSFCGEFEKKASPPTEVGAGRSCGHPTKEEPKQKEYPSMNTYQCPECGTLNGIFTPNNKWCSFKCNKCHNYLPFKEWQRFILKKQPPKEEPQRTYSCPHCRYRILVWDNKTHLICPNCGRMYGFLAWKLVP